MGKKESEKFYLLKGYSGNGGGGGDGNRGVSTGKTKKKGKLPPGLEDIDFDELLLDDPMFKNEKEGEGKKGGGGHECFKFGPLREGKLEILDKDTLFKEIPSKVDNFIGRSKEL
jgi:hypothetical protein